MSKFYGMVEGSAQTNASRRGVRDIKASAQTNASRRGVRDIKASAQSWDGSVITRLYYDDNGVLQINICLADGSSFFGQSYFTGTLEELKEKLSK